MNNNLQKTYFDNPAHRFDKAKILFPPLAQQLELAALEKALNLKPGSQLIDFGAGSGRVTIYFLQRGYHVLAVDISPKSISDLKKFYQQNRNNSWGNLTTSTVLPERPVAQGVVGADILHHVNIPEYLPKLKQVLKPDGRIAFSEPNAWHLPWYLFWLMNGFSWSVEKGVLKCTLTNLCAQFKKVKFRSISITGHGLFPTSLLNPFPYLCRGNALIWSSKIPFKLLAFRFIISAIK